MLVWLHLFLSSADNVSVDQIVPAVQKIVYSTCSVHAIENEEVVSQALASDDAQSRNFRLARREDVLTSWPRRGIAGKLDAEGVF